MDTWANSLSLLLEAGPINLAIEEAKKLTNPEKIVLSKFWYHLKQNLM